MKYTVEISLQDGVYTGTVLCQVRGYCTRINVLETVLSTLRDGGFTPNMSIPQNQKHIEVDLDGLVEDYKLFNPNNDVVSIDYEYIEDYVVGVRIAGEEDE